MLAAGLVAAIGWLGPVSPPPPQVERRLLVVDLMPPRPAPAPAVAAVKPSMPLPRAAIPPARSPIVRIVPVDAAPAAAFAPPVPIAAPLPPAPSPPAQAVPIPAPVAVAVPADLSATMIEAAPPAYPVASRRLREQGTVILRVQVGTDGRVQTLSLVRSSGFDRLDDAALRAVRKWRWSPVVRDGQRITVVGTIRIPFVLKG